jgi:hypothetical protein
MRTTHSAHETRLATTPLGPQLVRWGSVFSGTLIALALFALLDALWLALSFGSHDSFVYTNLSWWIGGTAIFCMFIAGLIAGVTSGARGVGAGSMGGLTTWALIVIGAGAVVLPTFGIGHVPNTVTASGHIYTINYLTYWTTFYSLVIGLCASVVGGMMGGATQRRVDNQYLDLRRMETQVTTDQPTRTVPLAPAPMVPASAPVVAGTATSTGTVPVVYQSQT